MTPTATIEQTNINEESTTDQARDILSWVRPETLSAVLDGPSSGSDLRQQAVVVAGLKRQTAQLMADIEARIASHEHNLKELRRRRDQDVARLRGEYDCCLDKGDAVGADAKLDSIRQAHAELANLARNSMNAEADCQDLAERQTALRLECLRMVAVTRDLAAFADALHKSTCGVHSAASDSAQHHLWQLDRTIGEAKKDAEAILAE